MTAADIVISLVISLFSGAAGGVSLAAPIAKRTEEAKQQFIAENNIRGIVTAYRDTLAYGGEAAARRGQFSSAWQNSAQEKFTESVLRELSGLKGNRQIKIRDLLEKLVGLATVNFIASHMNVYGYVVTQEGELGSLARATSNALATQDLAALTGQVTPLLSEGRPEMRVDGYKRVIATLDVMVKEIK